MLKIGDFSRLAQVTVKALRHYDRLGLLRPEQVDPVSGYRLYTAAQLTRLYQLLTLKELGLSLAQIRQLLDANLSAAQLGDLLRQKETEVQQAIVVEQERLLLIQTRLQQLTTPAAPPVVTIKAIPALRVAALRGVLPAHPAVSTLVAELRAYQQRHALAAGDWLTIWHDGEYRETAIQAEAAFVTDDPLPDHPRIQVGELPAVAMMACTTYCGDLPGLCAARQSLVQWLGREQYQLAGPNRTVIQHIAGPGSAQNVLEVQYPVMQQG